MINEDLRNMIKPNARLHLAEKFWDKIDNMIDESYAVMKEGRVYIALAPVNSTDDYRISLMFDSLTGSYYDIDEWTYIQQIGRKL